MRTEQSVKQEIREYIDAKVSSGVIVHVDWITTAILEKKDGITGSDVPFYMVCAHDYVKRAVGQCIGKFKPSPGNDRQLPLPGFDHLQQAYLMQRDNESVLVPIDQLTTQEIEERACEYEAMAQGCIDHAAELRKYAKATKVASA